GDGQTVALGAPLKLQVRVTTAQNVALPGIIVNWVVSSGGGSLSSASSATDATGLATVTATVGNTAGINTFTASVQGYVALGALTFTATASSNLSMSPASIDVNASGGAGIIGAYDITISF